MKKINIFTSRLATLTINMNNLNVVYHQDGIESHRHMLSNSSQIPQNTERVLQHNLITKIVIATLIQFLVFTNLKAQKLIISKEIAVAPMLNLMVIPNDDAVKSNCATLKVEGNDEYSKFRWESSKDGNNWRLLTDIQSNTIQVCDNIKVMYVRVFCFYGKKDVDIEISSLSNTIHVKPTVILSGKDHNE